MSRMLPERPAASSTKSEKEVFELIRNAPNSDDYFCLHSVGLARHKRKAYGEADFIVIGPAGVYCLEVKGGKVRRDKGTWHIGWPGKEYTSSEGPFKQAQGLIYPLISELESRVSIEFKKKVLVGWGVVFPHISFDMRDPEWDLDVVCDIRHKNDFVSYIERLSKHTRSRESTAGRQYPDRLAPKDCERIIECFRRDFDLVARVGDMINESQQELTNLSEQQYAVLRYILDPQNPRVMCPGGAGTGKTLIGLEAARRFGRQGKSVLFLCYNRILGEHLRQEILVDDGDVNVWSLHQYMYHIINEAGFGEQILEARNSSENTDVLFREIYPDLFETALLELLTNGEFKKFDVLVVDEGQDVLFSPTIDVIGLTLNGELASGRWMFLFDPDLQSEVYGRMDKRVLDSLSKCHPMNLRLEENYRNPEPVVDEMCLVTGAEKPVCRREFHSRVDYRSYDGEKEQGKKLRALLLELIKGGVSPSSVTILSGCRKDVSCVEVHPPEIGKDIIYLEGKNLTSLNNDTFSACTVSAFKGMENEIIILTDLPAPDGGNSWDRSIIYVGMTRATTHLYAIVNSNYLKHRFE